MSGAGHNGGPTLEPGGGWRRYAWKRARADLMPKLPLEVARRRVRRARELGLDYKAYAAIRAATGRDIVALLFSSNALRLLKDTKVPEDRAEKVAGLTKVDALSLVHPPLSPSEVREENTFLLRVDRAPGLISTWGDTRARLLEIKGQLPADGVLVVGDTSLERGWSSAGRLAGFIPADQYFA